MPPSPKREATVPAWLRQLDARLPSIYLIGVSGGLDSMALLHASVILGRKPVVLHFDHQWRPESREESAFVRTAAKQYGLPFYGVKSSSGTAQTEEAARAARWKFFKTAALKFRCQDLVLAHHADDQVETYLMQLFRGGSAAGMISLTEREGIRVHRPWLDRWRKEIEAEAIREKLKWREDSSNQDARYRRNWIRLELLPLLEMKFSVGIRTSLWRSAEVRRAELEELNARVESPTEKLSVKALREKPLALQRLSIKRWLTFHRVKDVGFVEIEQVRGLLHHTKPAKVNLTGGLHVRRTQGLLWLE